MTQTIIPVQQAQVTLEQLVRRAARGEIKILPTVSVPEYRKKADALSKELRELDMRIQRLNWTTDLM